MTFLACKIAESLIESNKTGLCGVRKCEKPAVAYPFGGRLCSERRCKAAKFRINSSGLRIEIYALVLQPTIVDTPCLAQ